MGTDTLLGQVMKKYYVQWESHLEDYYLEHLFNLFVNIKFPLVSDKSLACSPKLKATLFILSPYFLPKSLIKS